jgi:RNA polymerase sigma-70 factor (ECF subfamily)
MSATTDTALLTVEARALNGERAAWDELVALHRRRVLVALLAEGLSLSNAEELCQETWSRLWQQQQRGGLDRLELPGLAVTQARFLARDERRANRVREQASREEHPASVEFEAAVISRQQLGQVEQALGRLSAQAQRVFRMAQHEQVPHAEVAERVGLSVQRVRQIIFEVRTVLRAELKRGES